MISFQYISSHGTITDATKALSGKSFFICLISFRFTSRGLSVISSILFNPISRLSAPQMAPYLGPFTFTIGGPSTPRVFQTTPPQPASKARRTLYSLSVGGAEASQNGLGDFIPQKLLAKSAIIFLHLMKHEYLLQHHDPVLLLLRSNLPLNMCNLHLPIYRLNLF